MINYKIIYNTKDWDNNGTYYNQTLSISLSRDEFRKLNYDIAIKQINHKDKKLKFNVDTFKKGVNHTTISQLYYITTYFNIPFVSKTSRLKMDRNTIVKINII